MSDKYTNILAEIEDRVESLNLSIWETDFIDSLREQIDAGRSLSERQKSRLTDLYEDKVLGW